MADGLDLDAYLARLGEAGPPGPDADGLARLHAAHACAIPFENVDVLLGPLPALSPAALQDKMVTRRRGGYCYEQNGLLHLALAAAGFAVRARLARVLFNRPAPGPRSHQFLVVTIAGRDWLADVGFGGPGLFLPMPVETGRVDAQHGTRFRLQRHDEYGTVLQRARDDGWMDLYAFADEACLPVDIEMANYFTGTAPQSPFRRTLVCVRPTPDGRATLRGARLSLFHGGGTEDSRLLGSVDELGMALAAHFGLVLPRDTLDRLMPLLEG
jgi:N-hydroxyarylamine O-acetyltransferase